MSDEELTPLQQMQANNGDAGASSEDPAIDEPQDAEVEDKVATPPTMAELVKANQAIRKNTRAAAAKQQLDNLRAMAGETE